MHTTVQVLCLPACIGHRDSTACHVFMSCAWPTQSHDSYHLFTELNSNHACENTAFNIPRRAHHALQDELDSLGGSRERGDLHEASRRLLSVLLREMDGFDAAHKRAVVIGATNRKEDLDPALLSRFDMVRPCVTATCVCAGYTTDCVRECVVHLAAGLVLLDALHQPGRHLLELSQPVVLQSSLPALSGAVCGLAGAQATGRECALNPVPNQSHTTYLPHQHYCHFHFRCAGCCSS